jgi:hypothetical protein
MRKFLITAVIISAATNAMAQKGSWYLGGNVGFSSTKEKSTVGSITSDGDKTTTWTFSPEVGTFVTNHVQVGVGFNFRGTKVDDNNAGVNVTTNSYYGGTVYGRYFFGSQAFRPFVGANVSVLPGKSKIKNSSVTTEYTLMNWGANVNAGFGYALSKKVTAVGSLGLLGFAQESVKNGNVKNTSSQFSLDANSLGNRFTIGVYVTL